MSDVIDVTPIEDIKAEATRQEKEAQMLVQRGLDIKVCNDATADAANRELRNIKSQITWLKGLITRLKAPAKGAIAQVDIEFKDCLARLVKGEQAIKHNIQAYIDEQQRLADEEAALEEEESAKETQRLENLSKKRMEEGKPGLAEKHAARAESIEAPVAKKVNRPKGFYDITTWKAEVPSIMALAKEVVAGIIPPEALRPNMTYLNSAATLYKRKGVWDSVRFVEKKSSGQRGT
jgi:hypothetical protein